MILAKVFQQLTLLSRDFTFDSLEKNKNNAVSTSVQFQNAVLLSCRLTRHLVKYWIRLTKSVSKHRKWFVTLLGNVLHWKRTSWGQRSDSLCLSCPPTKTCWAAVHSFTATKCWSLARKLSVPWVNIFPGYWTSADPPALFL